MALKKPKTDLAEAKKLAGLTQSGNKEQNAPINTEPAAPRKPEIVAPDVTEVPATKLTTVKQTPPISKPKQTKKQNSEKRDEETVRLQIEIPTPEMGQSKIFDQLCNQVGLRKATLLLIKKSFDLLENDFSDKSAFDDIENYVAGDEKVNTTRSIKARMWSTAIQKYDPLEFHAQRHVANEIAKYAVSRFIQSN